MLAVAIDGDSYARGDAGNLGSHSEFVVERFDFIPINFETDQDTFRAAILFFAGESVAADEIVFFQIHELAEADFRRRIFLRRDEGFFAGGVVHFDEDQAGFNSGDIERNHSSRMNIEGFAFFYELVPDFSGIFPGHPNFKAEVAGVARARDIDGHASDLAARDAEIFEVGYVRVGGGLKEFCRGGTLQSESGDLFGNVFDVDVEGKGVLLKPAEAGVGGGPAIVVFAEAGDGAVVDHFAIWVAPAAVNHLIDGDFVDVARNDAVDEAGGVGTGDAVFEERRNVDERGGIADGVVFVLVVHFVNADGVIAGPFAIVQAFAEGERLFVKGGSDGHEASEFPALDERQGRRRIIGVKFAR